MSTFTRQQWAEAFLHKLGQPNPHPWMIAYIEGWTCLETGNPNHYVLHNLLNTTQPGYGDDLLPHWNSIGVRVYPTFEDGVAANAAALIGGPIHYYSVLLDALRTNNGTVLHPPTPEIVHELNTWSGNANYAQDIADLANSGTTRSGEVFLGRYAGQP